MKKIKKLITALGVFTIPISPLIITGCNGGSSSTTGDDQKPGGDNSSGDNNNGNNNNNNDNNSGGGNTGGNGDNNNNGNNNNNNGNDNKPNNVKFKPILDKYKSFYYYTDNVNKFINSNGLINDYSLNNFVGDGFKDYVLKNEGVGSVITNIDKGTQYADSISVDISTNQQEMSKPFPSARVKYTDWVKNVNYTITDSLSGVTFAITSLEDFKNLLNNWLQKLVESNLPSKKGEIHTYELVQDREIRINENDEVFEVNVKRTNKYSDNDDYINLKIPFKKVSLLVQDVKVTISSNNENVIIDDTNRESNECKIVIGFVSASEPKSALENTNINVTFDKNKSGSDKMYYHHHSFYINQVNGASGVTKYFSPIKYLFYTQGWVDFARDNYDFRYVYYTDKFYEDTKLNFKDYGLDDRWSTIKLVKTISKGTNGGYINKYSINVNVIPYKIWNDGEKYDKTIKLANFIVDGSYGDLPKPVSDMEKNIDFNITTSMSSPAKMFYNSTNESEYLKNKSTTEIKGYLNQLNDANNKVSGDTKKNLFKNIFKNVSFEGQKSRTKVGYNDINFDTLFDDNYVLTTQYFTNPTFNNVKYEYRSVFYLRHNMTINSYYSGKKYSDNFIDFLNGESGEDRSLYGTFVQIEFNVYGPKVQ